MGLMSSLLTVVPTLLREATGDLASRVRLAWSLDKEMVAYKHAAGESLSDDAYSADPIVAIGGTPRQVSQYLRLEHDLLSRYIDYELMDDYGEVSAVLSIMADDATQPDPMHNGSRVWISSPDEDVALLLNGLLSDTLRFDEEVWSITRTLCKYGTCPEELVIDPELGVVALNHIPTPTFRRVEGVRGRLYGFVQDFSGRLGYTPEEFANLLQDQNDNRKVNTPNSIFEQRETLNPIAFEPWQIVHFRHHGKYRHSVYGHAVLEPARWVFRRLNLLEDLAVLYRAQRAPERYAFYVNVGNRPLPEAKRIMNEVKQSYSKKRYVNPQTGQLDLRLETLAPDQNIFIPVVDGSELTRIETLSSPSWQHMDDVEYFLRKLFAALHVPRAYLGQDEGLTRQTLSSEDVRFARTVLRIQESVRLGVEKICRIHMAALGIPSEDVQFTVHFTVPSAIYELAQLEVRSSQADLSQRLAETMSDHWIKSTVFHLSDDEIDRIWKQRESDSRRKASMEAETQKIIGGGGGGGGFGGGRKGRFESVAPLPTSLLLDSARAGIPGKESANRGKTDETLTSLLSLQRDTGRKLSEVRELIRDLGLKTSRRR